MKLNKEQFESIAESFGSSIHIKLNKKELKFAYNIHKRLNSDSQLSIWDILTISQEASQVFSKKK